MRRVLRSPRMRGHSPGFTLIEVLTGLVIAVLVILVVLSLFGTVTGTLEGQAVRLKGKQAIHSAMDGLVADLTSSLPPSDGKACALTLAPDPERPGSSAIDFCTATRDASEADLRWHAVERVGYRLRGEREGDLDLVRIRHPLVGPEALAGPFTNRVLAAVRSFRVEMYDGVDWVTEWSTETQQGHPSAARIMLDAGKREAPVEVEVFVPAGKAVATTLQREAMEP